MIFVTVGTHFQQFDRLVRSMDAYARDHQEQVIIQAGFSNYEPVHAKWFRFVETDEEMDRLYREADVIVAHGGAGTAITALSMNKPLVILPRLGKFDEHVDDQQRELSKALADAGLAVVIEDEADIPAAVERARGKRPYSGDHRASLVEYIRTRVSEQKKRSC